MPVIHKFDLPIIEWEKFSSEGVVGEHRYKQDP